MANFFVFLFLGSIIGMIIGMFKPSTVVRWKEEASRKDVLKIYFTLAFVSLVLITVFTPEVEKTKTTLNETSTIIKENGKFGFNPISAIREQ